MTDNVELNFRVVDSNLTISQTYAATTNLVVIHSLGPLIDTSWLSNLLLHDISHINILEFNIDVSSFLSPEKFEQRAAKFLVQLANYLSLRDHHQDIVFVAHSLGGLLLTRILSLAFQSPRASHFYKVAQLSRAIIFLGTPLHGSIQALEAYIGNFFLLYESLTSNQSPKINSFQERPLQHQLAPYLQRLQREFKILHRRHALDLRCVSFFEGVQERDNQVVIVPRDLVLSYEVPAIALQRSHQDLCNFSRSDSSYRLFLGELKKYIFAPNPGQILHELPQLSSQFGIPACLESPATRLPTLKPFDSQPIYTAEGLYSFGRTPLFKRWITDTQSNSFLWLHGKPGCGKTTLMGNLARHCQRIANQLSSFTVSYFFDHKKIVKESKNDFFQEVVEQLLKQSIYSQRYLEDGPAAHVHSDTVLTRDRDQITQRLETLLNHVSERHKVFFVVDALDECDTAEAATIVHFLRSLSATKRGDIRICLSSRVRYLQMQDEPCHHLDRNNASQIATFVKNQVAEIDKKQLCAGTITESIVEEITRKASGIFLWARLSVRVLLNAYKRGENLFEVLRSLPDDLESMYATILRRIQKDTTELARSAVQVLIWVLFAVRPLTIAELRDALMTSIGISSPPKPPGDKQLNCKSIAAREPPLQLFKHIEFQCCGLIEIEGDTGSFSDAKVEVQKMPKVAFIHDTVREYLDGNLELLRADTYITKSIRGSVHLDCAETSLRYVSKCQDSLMVDGASDFDTTKIFPFLNYATTCCIQHMLAAEHEQVETSEFTQWLSRLFTTNPKHWLSSWLSADKACRPPRENIFDSSCTFLHILSHFGLAKTTEAYLRCCSSISGLHPEIDKRDSSGRTPLCFAAGAGHVQNVRLLLDAGANVALSDHLHGQTALHLAAWAGHKDITTILLEAGAEVRDSKDGTSILSRCAALGHHTVVKVLLDKGANSNSIDKQRGQSALSLALSNRHRQVVSLLIEHDVDLNGKDVHTELTPLHHAIISKDPVLVRKLIQAGARVPREPVSSLPLSQGLWVDRVMQMLLGESSKTALPYRQCPKDSNNSKSGASNTSLPTTSQGKVSSKSSTKRSYSTFNEQNEEEEEKLPPNKQPFLGLPKDKSEDTIQGTFACHYLVYDSRQFKSRRCGQTGFPTIPRLKDHLRDHHRILTCEICGLAFLKTDKIDRDSHQEVCVQRNFRNYADGYDQSQDEDVRKRLRGTPEEEKWQILYRILFPHQESIPGPSPYFEAIVVTNLVNDFVNVQNNHFRGSDFREQLESIVSGGTAPNITVARITDLLRRSSGEIVSRFGRPPGLADTQDTSLQPQPQQTGRFAGTDRPNTVDHQPEPLFTDQDNLAPADHHSQIEENPAPSLDSGFQSMDTIFTSKFGAPQGGYNQSYNHNQWVRESLQPSSIIPQDLHSEVPALFPQFTEFPDLNLQFLQQFSHTSRSDVDTMRSARAVPTDGQRQIGPQRVESYNAAHSRFVGGQNHIYAPNEHEFDWNSLADQDHLNDERKQ